MGGDDIDKITVAKTYLGALEKLLERYKIICSNSSRREMERVVAQFRLDVRPIFNGIKKQFPEDEEILNSLIGFEIGRYLNIVSVDSCISYLQAKIDSINPRYFNTLLENAEQLKEEGLLPGSMLCVRLYCEESLKKYVPETDSKGKTLGRLFKLVKDKYPESQRELIWNHIETINQAVHNNSDVELSPTLIDREIAWVKEFKKITDIALSSSNNDC